MGTKETVRLPPDLRRRWLLTEQGTTDGRPVPLGRLVVLGLDAQRKKPVLPDVIAQVARGLLASLAEFGLVEWDDGALLTKLYLPEGARARWHRSGLSLPALVEAGIGAFWVSSGRPEPLDRAVMIVAGSIREGLAEAGLLTPQ